MQHFHIGDQKSKAANQTSNNANYGHPNDQRDQAGNKVETVVLNQDMKKELRKAHFNFGNDQPSYETSHKQQFGEAQRSASDMNSIKQAQTERKIKMRLQNFTYGNDAPSYTSMAKKDFPQHNNFEALQNLQKSKLNGLELRKTHFMLGTDPNTYNRVKPSSSVNQIYTQQLTTARPATISTLAKKSNV